jgi:cysteine synthase A
VVTVTTEQAYEAARKLARTEGILVGISSGAALAAALQLCREYPGSLIPGQFVNPANAQAHYETTGPEIWADTDGTLDLFVAGVGTGGTITGTGKYLKEKNPHIQIVGVEPADSAVLSGKPAGKHGLQGIGAGFVPGVLDVRILDRVVTVTTEQAYTAGCRLGKEEGVLAGISSGAALWAALELAGQEENAGKTIVALLPDSGERYLTTPMYQK